MNKVWGLVKVFFRTSYGLPANKNIKGRLLGMLIGGGLLAFWLYRLIHLGVSTLYNLLLPSGQENILLGLGLTISIIVVLIQSIGGILNVFFYSKDLDNLLPLPLAPYEILLAKLITPLFPIYIVNLFILAPILLSYGIVSQQGILYFLYSIIVFILLPIVPLVLMTMLLMIVMRYTNLTKNKDMVKIISGILSIAIAIGVNIFVRRQTAQPMGEVAGEWLYSHMSWMTVTTYFPPAYLGAGALYHGSSISGLLYLIGFILLALLTVGVFLILGQKMYYRSIMGLNTTSLSKKERNPNLGKERSLIVSYTIKELKLLIRTPAYFTGCIIQTFYMPIFMLVILVMDNDVSLSSIETGFGKGSTLLIMLTVTTFVLSFSPTALTSISREGADWFANQYLPIKARTIIYGKALAGWCVQVVVLLIGAIVLHIVLHYPLGLISLWFIISCFSALLSNIIDVYINAKQPNLYWENEQQALRGFFKYLISFFVQGLLFGGILLITLGIAFATSLQVVVVFGLLLLFHLLIFYIVTKYVAKTAETVLSSIE